MLTNVCVRIIATDHYMHVHLLFYPVTLSSSDPNVTQFRGFIIQARTQPGNDIVGTFMIVDDQTRVQECRLSSEDSVSPAVSDFSGLYVLTCPV